MTAASTRSALERHAYGELKSALTAAPARLGKLWPALTPLERAACWLLLPPKSVAAAAESLSASARWEAYQTSSVDCLAPLLEGSVSRDFFRSPTRREAALLRAGIAK